MKQFLYLFLYHCFSAQKMDNLFEGAKLMGEKKSRIPRTPRPYPGGFLPIPIPPLRGFSTFWGSCHGLFGSFQEFWFTHLLDPIVGDLSMVAFQFTVSIPSTNKPTWLTCGSNDNLPNFGVKSQEEGSLRLFVKCLLPVNNVLYSKMFKQLQCYKLPKNC